QRLLATKRAPDQNLNLANSQMYCKQLMGLHQVFYGELGKGEVIGLTRIRIDRQGVAAAVWRANDVGADDIIVIGIKQIMRPKESGPPVENISVCCQGMADPDDIAVFGIGLA